MPRFKPERALYIPKGAKKFAALKSSAVVYAYENEKFYFLIGFGGRRQKPDFHYRYGKNEKGEQRRLAKADEYFASMEAREAVVRDKRAKPHELKVGDVLRASWGYDQTNIDYYQVLRVIGKSMVEIQEIASDGYEDREAARQKAMRAYANISDRAEREAERRALGGEN